MAAGNGSGRSDLGSRFTGCHGCDGLRGSTQFKVLVPKNNTIHAYRANKDKNVL